MRKRITGMQKKYTIIQQSWLTAEDVKDLAECGPVKAAQIRRDIEKRIAPKTLPEKIPTSLLVDYLDLDVEYIVKMVNCLNQ